MRMLQCSDRGDLGPGDIAGRRKMKGHTLDTY